MPDIKVSNSDHTFDFFPATNAYWNNMLEPAANRSRNWKKEFELFKCPTEKFPYLSTSQNS